MPREGLRSGISAENRRPLGEGLPGVFGGPGIPMTRLREAAGVRAGEPKPFILPENANRLTARQRELILHTIRVLLGGK